MSRFGFLIVAVLIINCGAQSSTNPPETSPETSASVAPAQAAASKAPETAPTTNDEEMQNDAPAAEPSPEPEPEPTKKDEEVTEPPKAKDTEAPTRPTMKPSSSTMPPLVHNTEAAKADAPTTVKPMENKDDSKNSSITYHASMALIICSFIPIFFKYQSY